MGWLSGKGDDSWINKEDSDKARAENKKTHDRLKREARRATDDPHPLRDSQVAEQMAREVSKWF